MHLRFTISESGTGLCRIFRESHCDGESCFMDIFNVGSTLMNYRAMIFPNTLFYLHNITFCISDSRYQNPGQVFPEFIKLMKTLISDLLYNVIFIDKSFTLYILLFSSSSSLHCFRFKTIIRESHCDGESCFVDIFKVNSTLMSSGAMIFSKHPMLSP